jgi:uncharacterized iron-regulated protein
VSLRYAFAVLLWLGIGCAEKPGASPPPVTPASAPGKSPDGAPTALLDGDHPLVGKVWAARQGAVIEESELMGAMAQARFLLLGERHDNPDHHRLQARALSAVVRTGRRPAVVFEMLELASQTLIDRYQASPHATSAGFGAAVAWQDTSWPPYVEYQPIMDVAFDAGLRVVAGNIAHETARALVKEGPGALPDARRKDLRLDEPFPAELEAALIEELRASHCGHLPEALLAPMALAQHARDAQMARALLGGSAETAVLIAGAGHVRLDRGVPRYLALDAPDAAVVSVALVEVQTGQTDPASYTPASPSAPYHYLWFTPRLTDEDPCAAFGKPKR